MADGGGSSQRICIYLVLLYHTAETDLSVLGDGNGLLCMYGTIPIAASFSKSGMKDDWLAAFMMSSILLNPQLIIYSAALGMTALMIRTLSSFVCGIVAGMLVRVFYRERGFFNIKGFEEPKSRDTDPNILLRFLKYEDIARIAREQGISLQQVNQTIGHTKKEERKTG